MVDTDPMDKQRKTFMITRAHDGQSHHQQNDRELVETDLRRLLQCEVQGKRVEVKFLFGCERQERCLLNVSNKATARFIDGMVKNALGAHYEAAPWETSGGGEKFLPITTKTGKGQRTPATIQRHAADCFKDTEGGRAFLMGFPTRAPRSQKSPVYSPEENSEEYAIKIFFCDGRKCELKEVEAENEEEAPIIDILTAAGPDEKLFTDVANLSVNNMPNTTTTTVPGSTTIALQEQPTLEEVTTREDVSSPELPSSADEEEQRLSPPLGGEQGLLSNVAQPLSPLPEPLSVLSSSPTKRSSFFAKPGPQQASGSSEATTAALSRSSTNYTASTGSANIHSVLASDDWLPAVNVDAPSGEQGFTLPGVADKDGCGVPMPQPSFSTLASPSTTESANIHSVSASDDWLPAVDVDAPSGEQGFTLPDVADKDGCDVHMPRPSFSTLASPATSPIGAELDNWLMTNGGRPSLGPQLSRNLSASTTSSVGSTSKRGIKSAAGALAKAALGVGNGSLGGVAVRSRVPQSRGPHGGHMARAASWGVPPPRPATTDASKHRRNSTYVPASNDISHGGIASGPPQVMLKQGGSAGLHSFSAGNGRPSSMSALDHRERSAAEPRRSHVNRTFSHGAPMLTENALNRLKQDSTIGDAVGEGRSLNESLSALSLEEEKREHPDIRTLDSLASTNDTLPGMLGLGGERVPGSGHEHTANGDSLRRPSSEFLRSLSCTSSVESLVNILFKADSDVEGESIEGKPVDNDSFRQIAGQVILCEADDSSSDKSSVRPQGRERKRDRLQKYGRRVIHVVDEFYTSLFKNDDDVRDHGQKRQLSRSSTYSDEPPRRMIRRNDANSFEDLLVDLHDSLRADPDSWRQPFIEALSTMSSTIPSDEMDWEKAWERDLEECMNNAEAELSRQGCGGGVVNGNVRQDFAL